MAFYRTVVRFTSFKHLETTNPLLQYCLLHSTPLPTQVVNLLENTRLQFGDKLLSSVQVLQMNRILLKLINAKKVLDVGVYTGASSLNSALAIKSDGKVFALEKSKKYIDIAKQNFKDSEIEDKIEIYQGDAVTNLDKLIKSGHENTFDFSYIDADKANYTQYFDASLQLLRPGGVIAIDNTLYRGLIESEDKTGRRIDAANKNFCKYRNVELLMLNIGDGYTIAFKN